MILKLKTRNSEKGTAWRLLDKIKKIDYTYVDEPEDIKRRIEEGIIYINSYPNVSNKKITEICIVYENGLGEMFYTDDMVYVMNDAGKTCDTINV